MASAWLMCLGQKVNKLKARIESPKIRINALFISNVKVAPAMANYIRELKIPGIHLRKESKRFYPVGEISAHVVSVLLMSMIKVLKVLNVSMTSY